MHRKFIEHLCSVTTEHFIVKNRAEVVIMARQNKLRRLPSLGVPLSPLRMCVLLCNLMELSDAVQRVLVSPD